MRRLPAILKPYRERIEATLRPRISMRATPRDHLTLWQSKLGGLPYLPKGARYPMDRQGRPMFLVAQVNFAEAPHLEPFPEEGLLQLFITGFEYDYGSENQDYRLVYYPEVQRKRNLLTTDFDFLPVFPEVPLTQSYSLRFKLEYEPVSCSEENRWNASIPGPGWSDEDYLGKKMDELWETYGQTFYAGGHKLGGYAHHAQGGPYTNERRMILLQIDSDKAAGIMWGDDGTYSVFIDPRRLARRDFSKTFCYYDCY